MDGKALVSTIYWGERTSAVKWSDDNKSLTIETNVKGERGEMVSKIILSHLDTKVIQVKFYQKSFWGERKGTLVFNDVL